MISYIPITMDRSSRGLYGAEFWVPEDHMFKTAPECLDAFPDAGPACGVVSTTAYDELERQLAECKKQLEEMSRNCISLFLHEQRMAEAEAMIEKLAAVFSKIAEEPPGCDSAWFAKEALAELAKWREGR